MWVEEGAWVPNRVGQAVAEKVGLLTLGVSKKARDVMVLSPRVGDSLDMLV